MTATQAPSLELVKTATPTTIAAAGQPVTYTFLVTNTGNVPISGITIVEDAFTGSGSLPTPTCPPAAANLAPGASVTCTAVYTTTAADVGGATLRNTAHATGTDPAGDRTASLPDDAVVQVRGAASEPRLHTRSSDDRVAPGTRFWDRVRLTGLARGTTVAATARLYGPFTSRAAASCRPAHLARTVTWRVRNGLNRSPSVRVNAPGVYTWRVATRATAANGAATHPCGLAAETTLVAKPSYAAPAVVGGFSGTLLDDALARAAMPIVTARGFGLRAAAVTAGVTAGRMNLPNDVGMVAWLRKSAGYGDKIGTTVIAGHVSDRHDRPGALYRLHRAHRGQLVTITRGGTAYRYRVTGKATFDRGRQLPHKYFATTGARRLVLISCTGRVVYPNGHFHYTKYRVVVAKFVGAKKVH